MNRPDNIPMGIEGKDVKAACYFLFDTDTIKKRYAGGDHATRWFDFFVHLYC